MRDPLMMIEIMTKRRKEIEAAVSPRWTKRVTDEEMDYFIIWASRAQIYFGHPERRPLGDAFRGFAKACEFHKTPKKAPSPTYYPIETENPYLDPEYSAHLRSRLTGDLFDRQLLGKWEKDPE